jgi:hypothetical protein
MLMKTSPYPETVPILDALAIIVSRINNVDVVEAALKLKTVAPGVIILTLLMLPPFVPSKRIPDVL